jgi:hypothetical protein
VRLFQAFIAAAKTVVSAVSGMLLGVNSNWHNSWENVYYFSNLARLVGKDSWAQFSGVGAWTAPGGKIQPSVPTDMFRAYLSDSGAALPSGTYTVRWTGTGSVKLGAFWEGDYGWDTTGTFTFNYTTGNFLGVWFKGVSLTSLKIILPGMVTSYDAGNEWNTDYLAWFTSLGVKAIRGMDWITASQNFEEVWADRPVLSDIGWSKADGAAGRTVPYELQIDFANRMNVDVWLHLPTRCDNTYAANLGTLINTNLNSNLKAYIELGNEIWNTADPWGDNTSWLTYMTHTRQTAVGSATANVLTKTAHGLTNADSVVFFQVKGETQVSDWRLRGGSPAYVTVVDANNFKVDAWYDGQTGVFSTTDVGRNYLYIKISENANTNLDVNYSNRVQQIVAAMTTTCPRNRRYHVMGCFQNNLYSTTQRMNTVVNLPDIDFIATAPYSNGPQWGANINVVGTTVNPQVADTNDTPYISWGIYPAVSNPSDEAVKSGSGSLGAGGSGHGLITATSYLGSYTGAAVVTGLTNLVSYKAIFIAKHNTTYPVETRLEIPFTIDGTTFSLEAACSSAAKALIDDVTMVSDYVAGSGASLEEHIAQARGVPLIAYEGGPHEDKYRPTILDVALYNYYASASYTPVLQRYLSQFAIKGVKRFFFYKDVSKGRWGLTRFTADVADNRYNAYKSFLGNVPIYTQLANIANSTHTRTTLPALPYLIRTVTDVSGSNTLDSGALTFEIVSGNSQGRFDFSGNNLRLINTTDFSWTPATTFNLVIKASTQYTVDYATVAITLGA